MVVDDESDILHLIFRALRNEGYDTIGAETAEEALVQFNNNPVDIVLLDLMLPDKSGYDVLEQLKTINPTLPVIILTALDTRLNKISGLELGADDYVTKPFDAKELASRVKARCTVKQHKKMICCQIVYMSKSEARLLAVLGRLVCG